MRTGEEIVRGCFEAYRTKDRALLEGLLAEDFRFTSPYDRGIDRAEYFRRCWPNAELIRQHDITDIAGQGGRWFVRYLAEFTSGGTATNVELFEIRDGTVRAVEVYFGDPTKAEAEEGAGGQSGHG